MSLLIPFYFAILAASAVAITSTFVSAFLLERIARLRTAGRREGRA